MRLTREDVIRSAVELLDEVGLDRLTTRALTTRLGVAAGALYWHVRSKAELLSAVAEEIMRPAFTPPPHGRSGDWAAQTTAFAHRTRRALLAHRDGARVVAGHLPLSAESLEATEAGLALLRATGLPLAKAAQFGHAVTCYVTGFVLQEQAAPPTPPGPLPEISLEHHPNLARWIAEKPADNDRSFAAGLSFLLDGLRAGLRAGLRTDPPPA
ncbi:TetR/AcrR family transcriptional regulator C-terminal domain-containing protein [Streptomyces sp. NRRL WC-3742]|uniref:TetR/AcrR family transcriptional regulator C-terminal domain-containing protein n=1 Tax=Streptomyces sp. NRRL WC-3742 TaxID=1463934 RepID=UPI0004CC0BB7|nr:TetR/AcrR family transcriptional regulator C-terminal domain-containing protein [Streptomyces sp. NRRL WC-3742]